MFISNTVSFFPVLLLSMCPPPLQLKEAQHLESTCILSICLLSAKFGTIVLMTMYIVTEEAIIVT